MKRGLRASTLKKSSESNLRRQKPVIKRKQRLKESDKLLKSVESNQNILQEEINRLSKISVDSSSDNDSIVSLEWDSQHDIESPPKEELDLISVTRKQFAASPDLSTNPARKRSVSVSVNRATFVSTESGEVDLHPVNRSLDHQFLQDTLLERNLQNRREKELGLIIEEHSSRQITMDENVYQEHILNLKRKYAKTIREIEKYTVDRVHPSAKEVDKEKLQQIVQAVDKFLEEVDSVSYLLDENVEKERYDNVKKFESDIIEARNNNEKEILDKFTALEATRSKADNVEVKRLNERISILKEKSVKMLNKLKEEKETEEMDDNEVREGLLKIKDSMKDYREIERNMEKIREESVGLDLNSEDLDNLKTEIKSLCDTIEARMETLDLEDKSRGLYSSIGKNMSRDNVVFPDPFSGEEDQNVHEFVREFKQAMQDSLTREKDQLKVLMKHLTGNAKTFVMGNHSNLDSAVKALLQNYGDKKIIWKSTKDNFRKRFNGEFKKIWGSYGDKTRVDSLEHVKAFITRSMDLAEKYPSLSQEIYHSSTFDMICDVIPKEYYKGYNDFMNNTDANVEDHFMYLKDYLQQQQNSARTAASKNVELTQKKYEKKVDDSKRVAFNKSNDDGKCLYCEDGERCRKEWGGFGCLDIYRLTDREERKNWLLALKLCVRCGTRYGRDHKCDWSTREKRVVKCQMSYCVFGAVTCLHHSQNMSRQLANWLTDNDIDTYRFNSLIYNHQNRSFKANDITPSPISISKLSKSNREELQQGKASCPIEDQHLKEYFEEGMKMEGLSPDIRPIPDGEPIFILNVMQGKTRPLLVFIDGGCNCFVAKEGVPEKELTSVKLRSGPIDVGVASGITVKASGEWASLLPLADGGMQVVRGLTMKNVTQNMPTVQMLKVFNALKAENKDVKCIQKLSVPETVGGSPDIILGIKYASVYPELVHQFPNGLCVYKSKLKSVDSRANACIGGPVGAIEGIDNIFSGNSLQYIIHLTQVMRTYKPRMEFFPDSKPHYNPVNFDIEDLEDYSINGLQVTEEEQNEICCIHCMDHNDEIFSIQKEMKGFMKFNDTGLDLNYKCPKCRSCQDCTKGSGYESISLKQEQEQQLIKESVTIDLSKGRAMADLPFKKDPKEFLNNNSREALKRLQHICNKYKNDQNVKSDIEEAFSKLRRKKHLMYYEDLDQDQISRLESEPGYVIPWNVVWKESSLSTPMRTVYDASSKTSSGYSLNDVLAVGIPDIVRLLDVLLQWHIGPVAIVGDVSQFYCSIGLNEESWKYQKVFLRENMNPDGKLIKAVIVSAIFGVCSSGGQAEEAIRKLCDVISTDKPDVTKFLLLSRYVDDLLKSVRDLEEANELIKETEKVLETIRMVIKGWCISGQTPPKQMTDDGTSITFSGLTWYPNIDSFGINIQGLHFGKRTRGRFSRDLDVYDVTKHGSIENFLKNKVVTRRVCTSFVARVYDMYGKIEPLKLRLKYDLRRLIYDNPSWDDPISSIMLVRWTKNFKLVLDCKDFLYSRCIVPDNALNLKARIHILCDAADGGIMIGVYAGFQTNNNTWTCNNILGRSMLPPEEWTTNKKELHGLCSASNLKVVVERALDGWIENIIIGCDSEIAIAWTVYESVKLNTFHRNRVNSIRKNVSLNQVHHVQGTENCADVGTRPDAIDVHSLMPGSPWLSGKSWMTKSYSEAINDGVLRTVDSIKLTNEAKKAVREGIVFDQFETELSYLAVTKVNTIRCDRVAEYEAYSRYIYPPLKRGFRSTVRITSIVLKAVRKFKYLRMKSKVRNGEATLEDVENQENEIEAGKFAIFNCSRKEGLDYDQIIAPDFSSLFNIYGVVLKSGKSLRLSDGDISEGLKYLFKKATQELLHFERKTVEKIATLKDGILFCNSRILEAQELQTVGFLRDVLDVQKYSGISFTVPVVSKNSPIALSIALHIHYNVNMHRGVESTFRLSLNHVRIFKGRQLFKDVSDDCIYCKKLRLRYVKQLMGPFSDTQLTISPIFYFCYLDMWGPIKIYAPGFSKRTRARQQSYDAYLLVAGCVVTGAVNVQLIEKRDTAAVLDGLTRFFSEVCVPKVMYPDQAGELMKALDEGEIDIRDMKGRLHKERGLYFETCIPQAHYQHGRIERRIKMLQESLTRSNIRNSRATATGWQTIAKTIEREVNSVPLGYLYHQGTENPLLRVLTPSLLKKTLPLLTELPEASSRFQTRPVTCQTTL